MMHKSARNDTESPGAVASVFRMPLEMLDLNKIRQEARQATVEAWTREHGEYGWCALHHYTVEPRDRDMDDPDDEGDAFKRSRDFD